ncbi:MAG: hypothetical protein R2729_14450 [Bryobacteraceae bacterium]
MGLEARCRAHYGKKTSEGKAYLESEALAFRGDFRVSIPFADMRRVTAKGADLHVELAEGTLVLELGPAAAKWEKKILNAPTRLEKLGVDKGTVVAAIGTFDQAFLSELNKAGATVDRVSNDSAELTLVAADNIGHLAQVADLAKRVSGKQAMWIVYPKGQRAITQADVMAAGKGAGLVDVKVASFSPTHTALKFVVPVNRRS